MRCQKPYVRGAGGCRNRRLPADILCRPRAQQPQGHPSVVVLLENAMRRKSSTEIIFVTGTDTGVGKTLLTALLLHHLRESGCHALATKPFCSGSRADVELLQSLQSGELS